MQRFEIATGEERHAPLSSSPRVAYKALIGFFLFLLGVGCALFIKSFFPPGPVCGNCEVCKHCDEIKTPVIEYVEVPNKTCWHMENGCITVGDDLMSPTLPLEECKGKCSAMKECDCVVYAKNMKCHLKRACQHSLFDSGHNHYDIYMKATGNDNSVFDFDRAYSAEFVLRSRGFLLNRDLDLSGVVRMKMDRWSFMDTLKAATESRPTLIVINDKTSMSRMVSRLGLPSNEVLHEVSEGFDEAALRSKLESLKIQGNPFIIKPTHASEGEGIEVVAQPSQMDADEVIAKIKNIFTLRPAEHESWILRHLKPAAIIETFYDFDKDDVAQKSGNNFFYPLELKVQSIWGRFFVGVMEGMPNQKWDIQYWIRRDGISACDRKEFQATIPKNCETEGIGFVDKLAKKHLPEFIRISEQLATKLGAPWLRVDFFFGGRPGVGIKLNELAYGSGLPYPLLDDDIARSMTWGFLKREFAVHEACYFLRPLGCALRTQDAMSMECLLRGADFPAGIPACTDNPVEIV